MLGKCEQRDRDSTKQASHANELMRTGSNDHIREMENKKGQKVFRVCRVDLTH